jgi:hypothetical protein
MSVLSYVRLRCTLAEGLDRYGRWIGTAEVAPRQLVRERDAIDLALANEEWLGAGSLRLRLRLVDGD